tara:strand:- start:577 stop:1116 length:540 start_codon:yes stop_codon:yes gene_type:complete
MVLLLFLLNCVGFISYEFPLLRINNYEPMPAATIGRPLQTFQWDMKPIVRVCATTEVPTYRVERAMRYWENLGYEFDGVRKDPLSTCMNPKYGEIIITLPETGFSDVHMASTRLYTSNSTGKIIKAKICILPKHGRKDRVLEHEIGHALGWKHYRKRSHIMHPTWHLGGYDSFGLRKEK